MLTIIVNPVAGGGYAKAVAKEAVDTLRQRGIPFRLEETAGPGHATELAREAVTRGDTAVVAIGGDGTFSETARALMNTGVPMGMIPAGTGNDFVKALGLARKPMDALEFILQGQPRPVDMVRLGDRAFLNVCGTGFDVTVLENLPRLGDKFRGLLPYLIGVLRAIVKFKPVQLTWTVKGEPHREDVLLCAVANGQWIGGGIPICPAAKPNDGLIDLVVVKSKPNWQIPFYLPLLMMGKILQVPFTTHIVCESASLQADNMRIEVDGELMRMDRAEFSVCRDGLLLYW